MDTGEEKDSMNYYWSDTCYWPRGRGYHLESEFHCNNPADPPNNYATIKVKEMLETRYLSTLGENNLKEVDGYKI